MEYNGYLLWRIECLKTHKKGGWVESELNLSQTGSSWIADNAKVYGEAAILDNARVSGNAEVFGAARITAEAQVYDNAIVSDYAIVTAFAQVYGDASVEDSAQIYGNATISGNALVSAYAKVYDHASVEGSAQVYDNVQVYGHATIKDRAYLYKNAHIKGNTIVSNNECIGENLYNWEDINALSMLKISLLNGAKTATLYANGKHQLAIKISLRAMDRKNKYITIPASEIIENIALVDEENNPIQLKINYTDVAGLYVYPPIEEAKQQRDDKESFAVIYVSVQEWIKEFRLCVRCKVKQWSQDHKIQRIKRVEYTTASAYNYSSIAADYITIQVLPKRQFNQSNIQVQTLTEMDVNGIANSKLTKYYVQFNPQEGLAIRHTSCIARKWFHYKQSGIYKGCTISTDQLFLADDSAVFTAKFEFTSSKFRKVMAKNHEVEGLCFWVYQAWEGLVWSYYEWGGEMYFSLFDQWGNEASLIARAGEEEQLQFYVRVEKLNYE